ncbi:MAG: RNA polymerase sigma factor [Verrucomicrobiota bacterium]
MVTDRDLIERYLREGDAEAARSLLRPHETGLFGYLWTMLRHQQDSEDALQETFRKALQALPSYQERKHFKSWLFRIGHHTALDLLRRRQKIVAWESPDWEALPTEEPAPSELLSHKERLAELQAALDRLPEAEREVVGLRLHAELSFKEIAETLGAPLGTVLSRMHKAKERLRSQLTPA